GEEVYKRGRAFGGPSSSANMVRAVRHTNRPTALTWQEVTDLSRSIGVASCSQRKETVARNGQSIQDRGSFAELCWLSSWRSARPSVSSLLSITRWEPIRLASPWRMLTATAFPT